LVENGDFETAGTNGNPVNWSRGAWGTNTRSFTYPATGVNGSKSARVDISSYTSGDAKWYFTPINLAPGTYTFTDSYISNTTSYITIQYLNSNGTYTYKDLATVSPNGTFGSLSFDFSVPQGVTNVTIFHLIKSVGYLTIDNVGVSSKSSPNGVFKTGGVTLRFDDGWKSQYDNAFPKLSNEGYKGTFYIVTHQLADTGYPGFMSRSQITSLYNAGEEIGAHTRTHRDLTTLSDADQQSEINGSRQDLLSWNVGPILSFSYPFGSYNSTTMSLVQNAGFTNAAATIDGNVTPTSDQYQLERLGVTVNVTANQVKQWIDNAIANKQWLILAFHAIDYSGTEYSTTPETFNEIVDYLKSKNVPVVTASEGASQL
jgi:peptidoglycan/xylan/chitin deacetylase (PgdA/CDA1 family)